MRQVASKSCNKSTQRLSIEIHWGLRDANMRHWIGSSHYLNKRWLNPNWTLPNNLRWNLNQNTTVFIQENESRGIVKKGVIWYQPQYLNPWCAGPIVVLDGQSHIFLRSFCQLRWHRKTSVDQMTLIEMIDETSRHLDIKWRHKMETFSAILALCEWNPVVTDRFSSKRASNADLWCFFDVSRNKSLNNNGVYLTLL